MSEFMASNPLAYSVPTTAGSKSSLALEGQSSQTLTDEMTSAINQEHEKAEAVASREACFLNNRKCGKYGLFV